MQLHYNFFFRKNKEKKVFLKESVNQNRISVVFILQINEDHLVSSYTKLIKSDNELHSFKCFE